MKNEIHTISPGRREFLRLAALASGAAALSPQSLYPAKDSSSKRKPIFLTFIKPLQSFSYDDLADKMAELGFNGIEATVRRGGHVLPERVEEDLPRLVEALKKRDLSVMVMATNINEVSKEQHTEKMLKTGAALGIPSYRMNYYKYDLSGKATIPEQLESFKAPLADLIAFGREVGIQALYQNHSGANYCGSSLWDLHHLLQDHPKKYFASAFDIGHSLVEGVRRWPLNLTLMLPHIEMLYIKGPAFQDNKLKWGPLEESAHDAKKLFRMIRQGGYSGHYNLHVEYHMKSDNMVSDSIAGMKADLATLKRWLAAS